MCGIDVRDRLVVEKTYENPKQRSALGIVEAPALTCGRSKQRSALGMVAPCGKPKLLDTKAALPRGEPDSAPR